MKKGIYVLPNLFTTANLFCGFYSAIASMKGMYEIAAVAILIAVVLDGLDGRIARMTHTTSKIWRGVRLVVRSGYIRCGAGSAGLQLVAHRLREVGMAGGVSLLRLRCASSGEIQCPDRGDRQPGL